MKYETDLDPVTTPGAVLRRIYITGDFGRVSTHEVALDAKVFQFDADKGHTLTLRESHLDKDGKELKPAPKGFRVLTPGDADPVESPQGPFRKIRRVHVPPV